MPTRDTELGLHRMQTPNRSRYELPSTSLGVEGMARTAASPPLQCPISTTRTRMKNLQETTTTTQNRHGPPRVHSTASSPAHHLKRNIPGWTVASQPSEATVDTANVSCSHGHVRRVHAGTPLLECAKQKPATDKTLTIHACSVTRDPAFF